MIRHEAVPDGVSCIRMNVGQLGALVNVLLEVDSDAVSPSIGFAIGSETFDVSTQDGAVFISDVMDPSQRDQPAYGDSRTVRISVPSLGLGYVYENLRVWGNLAVNGNGKPFPARRFSAVVRGAECMINSVEAAEALSIDMMGPGCVELHDVNVNRRGGLARVSAYTGSVAILGESAAPDGWVVIAPKNAIKIDGKGNKRNQVYEL